MAADDGSLQFHVVSAFVEYEQLVTYIKLRLPGPLLIFIRGNIESDGEEWALSRLCQRNARAKRYCIWLGARQRLKTSESARQGRVQHITKK